MAAMSEFVQYVGSPDFHDGRILRVEQQADLIRVRVRGYSGREYAAEFANGRIVVSNHPEGMLLYSLSEMRGEPPIRKFAFANWDEEDDAALEIDATGLSVRDADSDASS